MSRISKFLIIVCFSLPLISYAAYAQQVKSGLEKDSPKVQIEFSKWTKNNRTEEQLQELRDIVLRPVEENGIIIGEQEKLVVNIGEMSFVSYQGSGIDWDISYALQDNEGNQLSEKLYTGKVVGEMGTQTVEQGGSTVVFYGVAVTFPEVKDDMMLKLEEDPLQLDRE